MRVRVQLFATLSTYLPDAAGGEGVTLVLDEGATVGQVMQSLQIPLDLPCLVVVNGRDADPGQILVEGDALTMFPPLAGG